MPKNYKTYASPKSFSEFQLRIPDQTGKIEQQKQREIRGAERAQRFLEENRDIYLRAQRLVNSAEDASRETNFRMQTLERQSYKDALDRDYKIEMDNLDKQNRAAQDNLKDIAQFSQTASTLVGEYLKAEEQKKLAAAHDVISRTGVTYDQMMTFQKMNDNLTQSEFAAQDTVQEMLGPDADPTLVNAMFTVYENRNTKRWVEHKLLFQNTLNKFPEFLEEKIRQVTQETGEMPADYDSLLAEAKREFMEVNFVGKARPEVLSGAGVYAKLDELVNNRRNLFLKDQRELRKKELSQDRQNSFHNAFNEEGIAGMIRWNSTNPSLQKRQDFIAALKARAGMGGAYALDEFDIDAILDFEGGGSNGKTLRESFPDFAKELEEIERDILKDKQGDLDREEKALEREIESTATDLLNAKGADGELTEAERNSVAEEIFLTYGGRESTVVNNARRITSDAQKWRQTEEGNNFMYKKGLLTVEYVMGGHYETPAKMEYALNLAKSQQQINQDPTTKLHLARIESAVMGSPEVLSARFANGDLNEVNHTLFLNKQKQNYRQYVLEFSAVEGATINQAREDALQRIQLDIDNALKKGFDVKTGNFTEFEITAPDEQQKTALAKRQQTGEAQLVKIGKILRDTTTPASIRYKNAAKLMNHAEIEKALTNFAQKQWNMPPVIRYVGEVTNRNPLQVLNDIAPYIGDGELTLKVNELNQQQRQRYNDFDITPYSPIRNTNRTAERTGRANVGDTKTGASAPIRPSMFKVVQYVSGDPAIRGKSTADGRIVYDNGDGPRGHGGKNYHNHYEFATQEQAARAKELFERNGYRVTSYLRLNDTGSAHSRGVAIDVAPPTNLPYTDQAEAEWSARANALIGFDPLENE